MTEYCAALPNCTTTNATGLRQEILNTILTVRRIRLMVIIPAQGDLSGSPLALAFLFIQPFLADWDGNNIDWGLCVQAHPNQVQTYIQIDITTYPEVGVQERERNFAFPVYVLETDHEGRNWRFYRYGTRTTNHARGMIEEFAGMSLM